MTCWLLCTQLYLFSQSFWSDKQYVKLAKTGIVYPKIKANVVIYSPHLISNTKKIFWKMCWPPLTLMDKITDVSQKIFCCVALTKETGFDYGWINNDSILFAICRQCGWRARGLIVCGTWWWSTPAVDRTQKNTYCSAWTSATKTGDMSGECYLYQSSKQQF